MFFPHSIYNSRVSTHVYLFLQCIILAIPRSIFVDSSPYLFTISQDPWHPYRGSHNSRNLVFQRPKMFAMTFEVARVETLSVKGLRLLIWILTSRINPL